jgi:hypothetical protein
VDNPNHKGNVAELAIATEAARLGLSVLKPLTEHERYDLAIEINGRLLRVQCKWARHSGDVVHIHVGRCRNRRGGYVRETYREEEIDALAAYCQALDRCYLLPVSMVAGKHALSLRTAPARNKQRAAINFAVDYELGAVAQLEERRHGMAEVRGSSPLSSTYRPDGARVVPNGNCFDDLKQTVGMDEFYAKLAQYVRSAEAGEEIAVTRWGRRVATLGPPKSS